MRDHKKVVKQERLCLHLQLYQVAVLIITLGQQMIALKCLLREIFTLACYHLQLDPFTWPL